jgi:hypothetical protein
LEKVKLATGEMVLPNLSEDPLWQVLHQELSLLLVDLGRDPKYKERVGYIKTLLADPRFLKVEQVYFVPKIRPWPTGD